MMSVGEAFGIAGEIYVLGIIIALGMAALIKLINHVIGRSEEKAKVAAQQAENRGGNAQ